VAWVISQLPGIPKDQEGPENQGRYKYRGIEAIKAAGQKLLAEAGVTYTPRAKLLERIAQPPRAVPGWQDWVVEFTWTVKGPKGDTYVDDKGRLPVTIGVGRDNSDKGVNKAQSQAEKYMLNALLQIADPSVPEPDAHGDYSDQGAVMTKDEYEAHQREQANPLVDRDTRLALVERVKALPDGPLDTFAKAWMREDPDGGPFLPTVDGKPHFGSLRRNDLPAAEALVLQAEKMAADLPDDGKVDAPADAAPAESVADRAARMAADHQKPQESASDAASGPEGDAGTDSAPETAEAPTGGAVPIPEDTALADPNGVPMPDLATMPITELAARVRAANESLADATFVKQVVDSVKHPYHHTAVEREIRNVAGQTVAEDEPIDHKRMRVSLMRVLLELHRREQASG
jgi:hypothetical protein